MLSNNGTTVSDHSNNGVNNTTDQQQTAALAPPEQKDDPKKLAGTTTNTTIATQEAVGEATNVPEAVAEDPRNAKILRQIPRIGGFHAERAIPLERVLGGAGIIHEEEAGVAGGKWPDVFFFSSIGNSKTCFVLWS